MLPVESGLFVMLRWRRGEKFGSPLRPADFAPFVWMFYSLGLDKKCKMFLKPYQAENFRVRCKYRTFQAGGLKSSLLAGDYESLFSK